MLKKQYISCQNDVSQVLKYLTAGITSTGVDYFVYSTLLGIGIEVNTSKTISVITAIILSYYINSKWTFMAQPTFYTLVKYVFTYGVNIAINVSVNYCFLMAFPEFSYAIQIAFLCAATASAMFSFVCLKFWVFRIEKDG
jgi:putative flippase GtrA